MNPLVGEVDFDAIDIRDFLVLVEILNFLENSVDIGFRVEVDAVLGNAIFREGVTKLGGLHLGLGHVGQQQGDTNQCVAAIVCGRIDDSAVSFATNNGPCFFHLRHNVDFANGCWRIGAAIFLCDIAEGTG